MSQFLDLESETVSSGPSSCNPSLEDIVDKVFYGARQDRHTGKGYIDIITDGDGVITLPTDFSHRPDDYLNWQWTNSTLRFYTDNVTGHVIMEVY
jgi:hypothetical protein